MIEPRFPNRPAWLTTLVFAAAAAVLFVAAALIMFSAFMFYDDEGYVLLSLRNFAAHGGLYRDVYTQYGPFPFVSYCALQALGVPLTHTVGRLITIGAWAGTAWACLMRVPAWARVRSRDRPGCEPRELPGGSCGTACAVRRDDAHDASALARHAEHMVAARAPARRARCGRGSMSVSRCSSCRSITPDEVVALHDPSCPASAPRSTRSRTPRPKAAGRSGCG